jgi:hypothetical protein
VTSFYISLCIAAFFVLVAIIRLDRISFGLPVAYLALLLINHLPGAYAHVVDDGMLPFGDITELGMSFTAAGAVCFVLGVAIARLFTPRGIRAPQVPRPRFWLFCLLGGWILIYGLTPLRATPSVGAAITNGAAIWILGVSLALRYAIQEVNVRSIVAWSAALAVYPVLMLVTGGFLSYGSAAIITTLAILAVTTRSHWRAYLGIAVSAVIAMNIFVNYYESRAEIRRTVWSPASLSERIDVNVAWIKNFHPLDIHSRDDLMALDERLNQNFFGGLAARRLELGHVHYLHGRSVSDAVIALVPRALWPDKPVAGGSGDIVRNMTGLNLNKNTSWGVGQVMEFQINFGMYGVIFGFLALGGLIGWIDARAAAAENEGNLQRTILYFLPGVALLQPIGSMVELSGSAAAALVAAFGWRWAWRRWGRDLSAPPAKLRWMQPVESAR